MDKYQDYGVKEFVTDEFFVNWIFSPNNESNQFWKSWISQNPHKKDLVRTAENMLRATQIVPLSVQLSDEEINGWANHIVRSDQPIRRKLWFGSWISGAAAVLILAIWSYWPKQAFKSAEKHSNAFVQTKKISNQGVTSRIIRLSDESLVVLRPNSTLTFPSSFGQHNREVSVSGEAFFEVHRDPAHPFLVKAGNIVTKVLGTSFDVSINANGESSVTVKTGKVQVFHLSEGKDNVMLDSVILLPNQQVLFTAKQTKLAKINIDKPLMLSPISANKLFFFTDAPLSEIVNKLELAYGVSIIYDGQKFKDYTITASLSNLPLEEKIRAICKSIDAKYLFEEDQIKIY